MPKGPKGEKRPADVIGAAVTVSVANVDGHWGRVDAPTALTHTRAPQGTPDNPTLKF